jgi:hypothetical protein
MAASMFRGKFKINKNFGNKLRTYRLFKNNINLEPYLSMKNDEERILLSKSRISNYQKVDL